MAFSEEKKFLEEHETKDEVNKKEALSREQLGRIRESFPKVPQDYLDYLSEIGSGTIREVQFTVKPFLFDFEDLGLEDVYELKQGVKFFGDNLNGDFAGFDFSQNEIQVVEFLHASGELYYTNKSFKDFIREKMLIDEAGNDSRI